MSPRRASGAAVAASRAAAALITAMTLALTGCGEDGEQQATTSASVNVDAASVVIDVRTPSEFAEGHLRGAVNIDVTASDFEQRIAGLDPNGRYVVYCRSGNRSAQAVGRMEAAGFTDLVDAGGLEEAATSTDLAIVTDR